MASWMSEVVAPRSLVRADAASDSAPLSPVVPICARMRMTMGRTRKRSLDTGAPGLSTLVEWLFM